MCDCLELTNKTLADQGFNTFVDHTLPFFGGVAQAVLHTSKIDENKRGKPMTMIASYCPFCGEKYPKEVAPST